MQAIMGTYVLHEHVFPCQPVGNYPFEGEAGTFQAVTWKRLGILAFIVVFAFAAFVIWLIMPGAGPFVDGTPITRYSLRPTGPNVRVQAVFAFDITFGEGELLEGEPVIERLYGLRVDVGAAISRFDKYFL